jgi:hypothetical protein
VPRLRERILMSRSHARVVALAACLALAGRAHAETAAAPQAGPWKFGVTSALNLSQSTFSSNWSGGDKGSIVWVASTDLSGQRQLTPSFNLSNLLQLAYGQTTRQSSDPNDPGRQVWDAPDKTTDLIAFESVGRFSLQRFVDPYVALGLSSQFSDQSDPNGSIHFNPLKLKGSAGVARVIEKTEDREIITRLGIAFRRTMAKSFVNPPTLETKGSSSNDGGVEWQTSVTRPMLDKKVLYKGQLLVYQPVFYSKEKQLEQTVTAGGVPEVADDWKAINVNFQNAFSAAITNHLSVNLNAQWVYNKLDTKANPGDLADVLRNIRKAGQFKETLALGLTYRLF